MDQGKRKFATALLAAASITALAAPARAIVYVEPGDAGQTLATAQTTTGAGSLTAITGTFSSASDADLFKFTITSPTTFSATTNNAATNAGGVDTELSLFSSTGAAIAENDDAAGGTTTDSTLGAGNSLYATLAVGTYYIGIASSGNEPVNSANQLLFTGLSQSGDTTVTRGPVAAVNPKTLFNFNSNESDASTFGAYEIDLTGAAFAATVPEPKTWVSLGLGASVAAFAFLRRRRQQAA